MEIVLPLSCAQKRLFHFSLLGRHDENLSIITALEFSKDLDIDLLNQVLKEIINRHDILRSRFEMNSEFEPTQFIQAQTDWQLTEEIIQLNSGDHESVSKQIQKLALKEQIKNFDLKCFPNFSFKLYRFLNSDHTAFCYVLICKFHHLLCDDWSINLFVQNLIQLYEGKNLGSISQYRDYIEAEAALLVSAAFQAKKQQLLSFLKLEDCAVSEPRTLPLEFRPERLSFVIKSEATAKIKSFCQNNQLTLFHFFTSLYVILLFKYRFKKELFIGFPVAGRYAKTYLNTMGTFVNISLLRVEFDKNLSFLGLCHYIKKQLTVSYGFQEVPYDEIAHLLNKKTVDLPMISMQSLQSFETPLLKTHYIEDVVESFDVLMSIAELGQAQEGKLVISLKYNTNILTQNTATRMVEECKKMLAMVTDLPDIFLG